MKEEERRKKKKKKKTPMRGGNLVKKGRVLVDLNLELSA